MTDKLSENQACTKVMVAIEKRFSETKIGIAVITLAEFQAISNHIETLENEILMLAAENHSLLSLEIQPEDYSQ